jgi:chorismate-pyruvate lyase
MQPSLERLIVNDPGLGEFQKILLTTDGTVTPLLEIHTRETIRVEKLEHAVIDGGPDWLDVTAAEPVLSRRILLRGNSRPWMFAHSWLVLSRLPRGMQESLRDTDIPIGQLWRTARLETFRAIVDFRREEDAEVAALFGTRGPLLSRSYVVRTGGVVMGLVTEKFPVTHFAADAADADPH